VNSRWFDSDGPTDEPPPRAPEARPIPWGAAGIPPSEDLLPSSSAQPPRDPPPGVPQFGDLPARPSEPYGPELAAPAWSGRDLRIGLSLVLLGFGALVTLVTVLALSGDPEADPAIAFGLALATLVFSVWIGAVVLILARQRGISMEGLGFRALAGNAWLWPVGTWFAGLLIVAAYTFAVMGIEQVTGNDFSRMVEGNPLPDTEAMTLLVWVVLGVAVILAAPFGEELFFRAFLFRAVQARWGLIAGMIVSGGLFAIVHFEVSVFIPFWGIGMLFAWAYHRSGSLWTPVLAHAIFNGISFMATISGIVT
jgi:uncharacterized protein